MTEPFIVPDISQIVDFEFTKALADAGEKRETLFQNSRSLTSEEIKQLEQQGNSAEDWIKISVCNDFIPANVRNNRFFGRCFLGRFAGKRPTSRSSVSLPSGIYDSVLLDSCISNECSIWNVRGMNNYFIGEDVIINNVGNLTCSPSAAFGNGREIVIGIETGGQEVLSYAELTIDIARGICEHRDTVEKYADFIKSYISSCTIGFGVVGSECVISNCPTLVDSCFGTAAQCDNVTLVGNATILSSREEPTYIGNGAYVRNSCIQWGCHVDSMAIVDDAVLTEHSHVERHGKVTHSILGPNTGIAEGEVTASLIGPFVGFHHQALLIGALWPEGKGNVAYGANIGSNHTSKAPDQEIYCGEGMFFGLGSNVKFPSDFSRAPYSIIATGVTTLPQKMTFPFSLINSPSRSIDGVSPAINELIPGWVLSDNLYTIKRNEGKYRKRNKARRSTFCFDVFRPDVIDLLLSARDRLRDFTEVREFYLESDIAGIGKNYVSHGNLLKAIETYTRSIEQYCLEGFYQQCSMLLKKEIPVNDSTITSTPSDNPYWSHQCRICTYEGIYGRPVRENLERLTVLVSQSARQVLSAKEKDDIRGRKIIDEYDTIHTCAGEDGFVKETVEASELLKRDIFSVMEKVPDS